MSKRFPFIILAGFIFLFSCEKEQINFSQDSIETLSNDNQIEIQTLTKLRLGFSKTVAMALARPEFRNYIKEQSQTMRFRGFNEILFGLHQNDKITNDLTLRQLLENSKDEEVNNLFQEDFFELLLKEDPMVCIKLPDLFFDFDWNQQSLIPMVYARTPIGIPNEFETEIAFHHTGYSERIARQELPKHFCLVVKYSEDYLAYQPITQENEKGISFFEFLPQVQDCWTLFEPIIQSIGITMPNGTGLIYLNKRELFQNFLSTCQGDIAQVNTCTEDCQRDCAPSDEINNVLKYMEMLPAKRFRTADLSFIFREHFHLFLSLQTEDLSFAKEFGLIGFRKAEFFENKFEMNLQPTEKTFDDLGRVDIPNMEVSFDPQTANSVITNFDLLLFNGWPENKKSEAINLYLDELFYEDIVTTLKIAPVNVTSTGRVSAKPSQAINHSNTTLNFCAEKEVIHVLGSASLKVVY